MTADLTADLAQFEALAGKATKGPWAFAIAPAEGSDETPAEWMAAGLTGAGPLYTLFVPATLGAPGGFIIPAVTGDGPNARNNAKFIADARTTAPALAAVVRAVLAKTSHASDRALGQFDSGYKAALSDIETAITTAWEAQR